jgi:glycosyltransferase involved in cell wall biosynthesis
MKLIHVITPGDHFSPLTGSAIPSVVHGLSSALRCYGVQSGVVIDKTTQSERYDSCEIIEVEYDLSGMRPAQRVYDLACGYLTSCRPNIASKYGVVRTALRGEQSPVVLYHNTVYPGVAHKLEMPEHLVLSWWGNDLTRTYSTRELTHSVSTLDGVVCCSNYIREQVISRLPKQVHSKVFTVLNGGPDPVPQLRSKRLNERPKILFLGRMVPQKGIHVLLQAILSNEFLSESCDVVLLGSSGFSSTDPLSKYQQDLQRLVVGKLKSVEFVPFQNRHSINSYIDSADVVVVPSVFEEPFGLVVLEANARGVPVIHSLRGGLLEASGGVGLCFDNEDVEELAWKLFYLLTNHSYYSRMSERSLDWARLSTWHVRGDSVCHLVESLRRK